MTDGDSRGAAFDRQPIDTKRLEVLLLDYEMGRDDERTTWTLLSAVFSLAVGLLSLLGAAATQVAKIPDLLLAGAPLLPLSIFAYMQMIGAASTLRNYYLRGLESELRRYVPEPMDSLGELRPASFMGIMVEMSSLRRGRVAYRLVANLALALMIIAFGGLTVYIGFQVKPIALQLTMLIVYGGSSILLFSETMAASIGGRSLFLRTARGFLRKSEEEQLPKVTTGRSPDEDQRSLVSYLVFPRPADWIKWVIAPGVFLVTAWSTGGWNNLGRFVLLWLILEYLIYLARYQWNDLRGLENDQSHAGRRSRGRLPTGDNDGHTLRNIRTSAIVALLRVLAAIVLAIVLGVAGPVLLLIVAVFGIAVVYEVLRTREAEPLPTSRTVVAIWLVVGLGYAVRAGVGFALGGLPLTSLTPLAGMACFAMFGVMFVLLTWALEATSYCRAGEDGKWYTRPELMDKPHIGALLRYLGRAPHASGLAGHDLASCAGHAVLAPRGRPLAPWNWAMMLSVALGALVGAGLAHGDLLLYSVALTLSIAGGIVLVLCASSLWRLMTASAITGALAAAAMLINSGPSVTAVPWAVISLTYTGFRASSYQDITMFVPQAMARLADIGIILLRLLIGRGLSDQIGLVRR